MRERITAMVIALLAVFVVGIILSAGLPAGPRDNTEKIEVAKEVTEVGDYTSEVSRYTKGGVEIDNYATRKVYYNGELIETIENKRALPAQVKPAQVIPAPGPKAKLVLIDYKNPFWKLDSSVKGDITCWVVYTDNGRTLLYDAVTGNKIGEGIPAPFDKAISLSGFHEDSWPDPWEGFRENGAYWYNKWGYNIWNVFAPSYNQHSVYIQNNACKYRYALAHGGSTSFQTAKGVQITDNHIGSWLANRDKMTFAFLGHCGGMCSTGSGTLSYAFRKGSMSDTVTIGYCNPTDEGWPQALNWQDKLFQRMDDGDITWKGAFDYANACYPECISMMVFVGDHSLTLAGGSVTEAVLTIQSEPSSQKVYVDGTLKGYTPLTVTVTCETHTIKVSSNGGGGSGDLPDLVITDTWLENGVSFKEKNIGDAIAGGHYTHVSGMGYVSIPSLAPGEEQTFSISGPPPYTWTVTADYFNEVEESNENNNNLPYPGSKGTNKMSPPSGDLALTIQSEPSSQKAYVDGIYKGYTQIAVTLTCDSHTIKVGEEEAPPKPDLIVTDVWMDNGIVYFTTKNIGDANAGPHRVRLYIDGCSSHIQWGEALGIGEEQVSIFVHVPQCTGISDTLRVVVDALDDVEESNENNNYMEKTFTCGGSGDLPDLIITQTWRDGTKIYFKEKNVGDVAAGSHWTSIVIAEQTKYASIDRIAPREEKTFYISFMGYPAPWTVCADSQGDITESNEDNNCMNGS